MNGDKIITLFAGCVLNGVCFADMVFFSSFTLADTSTTDYFNDRAGDRVSDSTAGRRPHISTVFNDDHEPVEFRRPKTPPQLSHVQLKPPRKPSLTKTDSVDVVDCK